MNKKKNIDAAVENFLRNQIDETAKDAGKSLLDSITNPEVKKKIEEIRKQKHVGRPRKDETSVLPDERFINCTFAVNEIQMRKIRYICKKIGFQQKEILFALFSEIIKNYETKHGVITEGENEQENIINSIFGK